MIVQTKSRIITIIPALDFLGKIYNIQFDGHGLELVFPSLKKVIILTVFYRNEKRFNHANE